VFSYRDYKWFLVPVIAPMVGAVIGGWCILLEGAAGMKVSLTNHSSGGFVYRRFIG